LVWQGIQNDEYHRVSGEVPGNPWIICTLWLARWHIARVENLEDLRKGMDIRLWARSHVLPSDVMAEQLDPFTGGPVSVSPLTGSHAEFVAAVCEYQKILREISSRPS
jgi:GH15 family glucan-1,4-alpha-glucosidase